MGNYLLRFGEDSAVRKRMFFDRPRTWILYEPMDRDKSLLLAMTSSFITSSFPYPSPLFDLTHQMAVSSYRSIIDKVQRKGGPLIKNRFQTTMLADGGPPLFFSLMKPASYFLYYVLKSKGKKFRIVDFLSEEKNGTKGNAN
ncbi:NADH-ubiquinone oxidoreductase chain 2 [Platanthera zijinensis]|uniref:NADH-ubiquinone oxidoreductase chain 2 n=1 Tax=Platanthera zijinensis TaxID=2320716 RepID=A0AAP0BCS1_9ASPA